MIEFKFLSPGDSIGIVKATVHKSGKLGFSSGAAKKMNLEAQRYFKVAVNAQDPEDKNLYLVLAGENDERALMTNKAGQYYYLRIKPILDDLGVDYKKETVIYDIQEMDEQGVKYYKLSRRKPTGKK